jgi:hypothetical protein
VTYSAPVTRAIPAQMERASRLLALEGARADGDTGTPAGRVYDALHARLSPLLGQAGVELLLVRSAKLAGGDLAPLAAASLLEGAEKLRAFLYARDPMVSTESAAALFGTFFTLLETFIGDRLTTQALRSAWPALYETPPTETRP